MRILLAGGNGFIGQYVCKELLELGHYVIIMDRAPRLYNLPEMFPTTNYEFINMDTADREVGNPNFESDVIIYLASTPEAPEVHKDPFLGLNDIMKGALNLLWAHRVKRFVYISSSMVYGDFGDAMPKTWDRRKPVEPYGMMKSAAEDLIKYYCKEFGTEYTIVRPSAVYGPYDKISRVISKFIDSAIDNFELPVKGNNSLDFTYVEDTAHGIVLAALEEAGANETFNISRGLARTISEAAKIVVNAVGSGTIAHYAHDPLYPIRGALDISKSCKLLGFDPQVNLEEGIKMYWDKWD